LPVTKDRKIVVSLKGEFGVWSMEFGDWFFRRMNRFLRFRSGTIVQ
jgi:hypothetical protein